jgi:hypothetical protein
MAALAASAISFGIIGCGGDDEQKEEPKTQTSTSGGEPIGPLPPSFDAVAEKAAVLEVWAEFMRLYNERKIGDIKKLWTNKASDYAFINISGNERIDAEGAVRVQEVLMSLTKQHTTANDNWMGENMTEVYIRSRGGKLQGSAHGPNALRTAGETWVYFEKMGRKWKINKMEAIEKRNIGIHFKIEIHENQVGEGRGYFDNPKNLVP